MKRIALQIKALIKLICFALGLAGTTHAAVIVNSSLSVSESYNDNIFFTDQNKVDDFVTIVSPALSVAYAGKDLTLSIGYRGRAFFYAENTAQNDFFHALSIDLNLPILDRQIRGVTVKIIEDMSFSPELPGFSFIEGDEAAQARAQRLPQGGGQGVQLRKTDTFQNQAGISLAYDWTERLKTTGQYTNIITRFLDDQFEDREVHLSTFDAAYRYPFSLRTALTNSYRLAVTTGDVADRIIHTLRFQLEHQITSSLSGTAGIGVTYIKDNRTPEPTFSAGLKKFFQKGTLSIQYTRNIASGLGIIRSVTRRQRVVGNADYKLTELTGIYIRGIYASNQSVSENEIDLISYTAATGISTQFLNWLRGSLNYSYMRQDAQGGVATLARDGERNLFSIELTANNLPWRIIK